MGVGRVREDESGIFDIKFVASSHSSELPSIILSCDWNGWVIYIEAEVTVLKGFA